MKRVVVTGIGIVSCLGNNKEEVYSDKPDSFMDNHAKLNFTWEVPGGGLRWWSLKNESNLMVDTHTQKNGKKWSESYGAWGDSSLGGIYSVVD